MSVARDPRSASAPGSPKVAFEVDRFEWTAGDRLELAGRWYGVRGRRFIRPTLDVELGDGRRRLLALLEHKPWTAVDGEPWVAAFYWEGDPVELTAELAVGPDLAVELPAPVVAGAKGRPATAPAGRKPAEPPVDRREARRPRAEAMERELGAARVQAQRVGEELDRVRGALEGRTDRLRGELELAEKTRQRLENELQEARDRVAAAEALGDRQREELQTDRDAAVAERDEALAEARQAKRERDAALRERAGLANEREAAEQARDRALEKAESSLDSVAVEREAARVERRPSVVIGGTPVQGLPVPTMSPIEAGSRGPSLGPRLVAFAVLAVLLAVLAVVLVTAIS